MHLALEASPQIRSLKSLRASEARRELLSLLGGRCSKCAATHPLEFDCYPVPETSHHFMPWPQRIRFYWQQHLAGNLRGLCKPCHTRATSILNSKVHRFKSGYVSRLISNSDAPRDWPCCL